VPLALARGAARWKHVIRLQLRLGGVCVHGCATDGGVCVPGCSEKGWSGVRASASASASVGA
jgi:hypothetical protein